MKVEIDGVKFVPDVVVETKTSEYHVGQKVKILSSDFYLGFDTPRDVGKNCYGKVTAVNGNIVKLDVFKKIDNALVSGGWWFELYQIEPWTEEKQDIREYCKEHRVWAAKDGPGGFEWAPFNSRPFLFMGGAFGSWKEKDGSYGYSFNLPDNLIFPSVPWDKSIIAPDGSMPLWGNNEPTIGKWYIAKGNEERGAGKLVKILSCNFPTHLLYHPSWTHGHDGREYATELGLTGKHSWYYNPQDLIKTDAPKEEPKRATHFEVGKWYVNVGENKNCWLGEYPIKKKLLDGKPHKCTRAVSLGAEFEGLDGLYVWNAIDWIEVDAQKEEKKKPHRGDPIFVWDNGASDRIPATVRYFSRIDKTRGYRVRVLSQLHENEEDPVDGFDYYRIYDASLVEVRRKDWPKE